MAQAFNRSVIEVDVGHFQFAGTFDGALISLHCEAVILGGNEHLTRFNLLYRMIPPAMPVGHLGCLSAKG
jgi:hypothetical protein